MGDQSGCVTGRDASDSGVGEGEDGTCGFWGEEVVDEEADIFREVEKAEGLGRGPASAQR